MTEIFVSTLSGDGKTHADRFFNIIKAGKFIRQILGEFIIKSWQNALFKALDRKQHLTFFAFYFIILMIGRHGVLNRSFFANFFADQSSLKVSWNVFGEKRNGIIFVTVIEVDFAINKHIAIAFN
ncbi:MAG: hypothetical protein BWZ03_00565 [bacterium ADurb.BinA186]|nr:MAG: hypothetical protein BWZ03_00565 [bacterium ADurb.BinA186]